MARPRKEGLDYFPLDVDIDQDDKVALIEAQHGITGFAVVIKLLMRIYKDGYFYEWGEKEQLLFSKLVNVDINSINAIINDCLKWGLFDQKTFDEHQVLTSKGVQKRYLEATARRNDTTIINEYILLSSQEVNGYINGNRKIVIVNKNGDNVEVLENINSQSKVKKSKEEESKEDVLPPDVTNEEKKMLSILANVKDYPFDYQKDLDYIRKLTVEYPDLDMHEQLKAWSTHKLDKPLKANSNPRSQIRTWCQKSKQWGKGKKKTEMTSEERMMSAREREWAENEKQMDVLRARLRERQREKQRLANGG